MDYREGAAERRIAVAAFGHHVVANDLATGARVWAFETTTAALLRVSIDGGRVYVLGRDLSCLDLESGNQIWKAKVPTACWEGTLLVVGDAVLLGGGGEFACVDAATGAARWHDKCSGMGMALVALAVQGQASQADWSG
jgi:outer membrane protein assembly factor BamB